MRLEKAIATIAAMKPERVKFDPRPAERTYTIWQEREGEWPIDVVYFMYSAGRIKIGFSAGLPGRHSALTGAGPFPPVIILVVNGSVTAERQFHERFAADRLHGEWFTLSKKVRDFLRARLCPIGRVTLRSAEDEFVSYCLARLAEAEAGS